MEAHKYFWDEIPPWIDPNNDDEENNWWNTINTYRALEMISSYYNSELNDVSSEVKNKNAFKRNSYKRWALDMLTGKILYFFHNNGESAVEVTENFIEKVAPLAEPGRKNNEMFVAIKEALTDVYDIMRDML